jgi:NAD-dependent deacetylase
VLFGEMLPTGAFEKAVAGAENCDIRLIVGTSGMVYPAATLPSIAKRAGTFVVEINCEETPLSEICDEVIKGKAGEVIPLL